MSDLQEIGAQVSAIAGEASSWAQQLHAKAAHLRQAASRAAQMAQRSEGGAGAMQAAKSLELAGRRCDEAAQHLMAGKAAAEQFVTMHVGAGGGAGPGLGSFGGADGGSGESGGLGGLTAGEIQTGTSENRVNLVDNVDTSRVPTYGGYLDVVMHGDATGTQAHLNGRDADFTLEETARLVESSPGWRNRPVRLMSCSTGQGDYAQRLADRLGVPVFAPNDSLHVVGGRTYVGSRQGVADGAWRRFEPGQGGGFA